MYIRTPYIYIVMFVSLRKVIFGADLLPCEIPQLYI